MNQKQARESTFASSDGHFKNVTAATAFSTSSAGLSFIAIPLLLQSVSTIYLPSFYLMMKLVIVIVLSTKSVDVTLSSLGAICVTSVISGFVFLVAIWLTKAISLEVIFFRLWIDLRFLAAPFLCP